MSDVLIVEDDRDIREVVAAVLADEGYVVEVAGHGGDALVVLREKKVPRLILLDLMMPVMNGQELKAALDRDPELSRIPVVLLTGRGDSRQVAEDIGARGVLQKPVDLRALLDTVARWCVA